MKKNKTSRKISTTEDCVEQIFNNLDIFFLKKEEAKKICENSKRYNKQAHVIIKVFRIVQLLALLFFSFDLITPQKEILGKQIIGFSLLIVSVTNIIIYAISPEEKYIDKSRKYTMLVDYYNKIKKIADDINVRNTLADNKKEGNFIVDSYLKVEELCSEYEQKEANET